MLPAGSTLGRCALRHLSVGLPSAVRQARPGRAGRTGAGRAFHGTVVAASADTKEKKPSSNDNRRRQAAAKGGGDRRRQPKKRGGDDESTSSAEDIRALRLEKVKTLKEKGQDPYAYRWDKTHATSELQALHKDLADGEEAGEEIEVSVAGRIMARRVFGKLAFIGIRDETGSIQLYCDKARLEEASPGLFADIKALTDVGDIVGVKGGIKRTEKGELSVVVSDLRVLTKSLLPLPDKFQGLKDIETRYRQRYVDLITNPGVLATFRTRALITSTLRRRLEDRGFLEMETPVLHGEAGGADARPFTTYHNALGKPLTMRIATELHLKRLVVGGFERVFEIGRIFRNEGVSTRHNPEFTSVEVYEAYADYHDMMDLTEDLVVECCKAVHGGSVEVEYQGQKISFAKPWRRETMHALVQDATGVDFEQYLGDLEGARAAAAAALEAAGEKKALAAVAMAPTVGHVLNEVFEAVVESTLVQPTFVLDHPLEISPLSKPHRARAGVVERFEVFAYGRELANSFSELTDPVDQRERLEAQITNHRAAQAAAREAAGARGKEALAEVESEQYEVEMDEDFVTALEYGMPPTAGMGMGVDRLVMLLTDSPSIRDVVAFPAMK